MKKIIKNIFMVLVIILKCITINSYSRNISFIEQGKYFNENIVNNIFPKMDKNQVNQLLGTPSFIEILSNKERWFYTYYKIQKNQKVPIKLKEIILIFQNEKLDKIISNYLNSNKKNT